MLVDRATLFIVACVFFKLLLLVVPFLAEALQIQLIKLLGTSSLRIVKRLLQRFIHRLQSLPFLLPKLVKIFGDLRQSLNILQELAEAAIRWIPHEVDLGLVLSQLLIFKLVCLKDLRHGLVAFT